MIYINQSIKNIQFQKKDFVFWRQDIKDRFFNPYKLFEFYLQH